MRFILSSTAYTYGAYGINLLPAGCAAEVVMQLKAYLAADMRDTGALFTIEELDSRILALSELEASGTGA